MKKSDIILLFLGSQKMPIVGTTKLQKLIFLSEKEGAVLPDDETFDFEPYKFGPISKKIYDELEFLVNIGYIEKSNEKGKIQEMDLNNLEKLSADDFLSVNKISTVHSYDDEDEKEIRNISDDSDDEVESDPDDEVESKNRNIPDDSVVYRITQIGINYLEKNNLFQTQDAQRIKKVQDQHAKKSLFNLLRYIYLKYPEYTTESEIKDDIL